MRTIVAVSGASGAILAQRVLERLEGEKHLVMSRNGELIAAHELAGEGDADGPGLVRALADHVYSDDDLAAPISSGSRYFDAMVVLPCSMSTLSKIACGISDTLITRAASVCLKEGRRLIIVPRETPISAIHLENMAKLAGLGVIVLPAMLCFYNEPATLDDAIDTVVGRVLDLLGQENDLARRWDGLKG
jgi:4-hydroxy-3-polyprenylbenzoate decarboxylase